MNAVRAALDLATIRDLVRPPDPMACVYLALVPQDPTVDTGEDLDLRWRSIAARLARQGADRPTIEAIGSVVTATPPYPAAGLAVFAAGGEVRLSQLISGGVAFDRARFAAPADVVPLLGWLQRHPPYVVVVTDRTGAEVTAVPGGGVPGSTRTVVGPDDEIERNAPGGWSQPRYQRRAEDSWQHNAMAVADVITQATRDLHAGLLLVAGDIRAVQLLRDHLPPGTRRQVTLRSVPGGREQDGSETARRAAIVAAVDGYVADQTQAALERFAERAPSTAVEGAAATLAALAAGRVGTLLVTDDPDDPRTAWFGPQLLCSAEEPEIPGENGTWAAQGRLVDIAIRAALLTDAEVRIVDAAADRIDGRIGGLCRFAQAT
jgi:hypothetical protein